MNLWKIFSQERLQHRHLLLNDFSAIKFTENRLKFVRGFALLADGILQRVPYRLLSNPIELTSWTQLHVTCSSLPLYEPRLLCSHSNTCRKSPHKSNLIKTSSSRVTYLFYLFGEDPQKLAINFYSPANEKNFRHCDRFEDKFYASLLIWPRRIRHWSQ